ncbi:MAG: Gfo/Idh/MocA family oxidoreductase [Clostridia bacterium]|nr:Gfo/Idh/MocA family oxidoreductase [Clostridia bacterium]
MVKIGIVGCGFMGANHSECYRHVAKANVTCVADVRRENAEKIARMHSAKVYDSAKELILNADVDVIDICLPTYLHAENAVLAMKKGRSVFIEKPVCMTKEEGALLLKTQEETGAKVHVGQVVRMWDEYVWLKNVADSGKYGKILSAVFTRISAKPEWDWENWLKDTKKSGDVALDLHIHDVDFMRYLLGEPQNVTSSVTKNEKGAIEQIFSCFDYKDAKVFVEGCWDYPVGFPFTMGYRVKFENATAVLDENGLNVYLKEGGWIKPDVRTEHELNSEIGGNALSEDAYFKELKYFVDCIEEGNPLTVAPLSEGVKSVELVLCEVENAGGFTKE